MILRRKRETHRSEHKNFPQRLLANYLSPQHFERKPIRYTAIIGLIAFLYGSTFAITNGNAFLQMTAPLVFLTGGAIWLLPESEKAPSDLVAILLFIFLGVLLLWPDYLAVALPGLPWITAIRLVGIPLAFVTLVTLSTSSEVRTQIAETLASSKPIARLMLAFALIASVSVAVSSSVSVSIDKLIVASINWFLVFYVSVYVFRKPGRLFAMVYALWIITIILTLIGLQEWRHSSVPWAGHIPSFLAVQDESVQRILSGASRVATGIYRVQSKFTTSLGFAEFYAYFMPFMLHFMVFGQRWVIRVGALLMIPVIFEMIVLTDSRLGMVGFFTSCLVYLLVWAIWRWQRDRDSAFGPLVALAYPAILAAFIAAIFLVGRLHALILGTGAQQASTDSRKLQIAMGIPKVLHQPWGYGIGRSADALGFYNGAGILTIDTYYLSAALEFGIFGFLVYYAIFIAGIVNAARHLRRAVSPEEMLIAPLMISMMNFLIIKSILSQIENHALIFAMLGASIAICWRIDVNWKDRAGAFTAPPTRRCGQQQVP